MTERWLTVALLAQVAPVPDFTGPWSEATKFGLLALVLWWVFYVHLPAERKQSTEAQDKKDQQLRELLEAAAAERKTDRQSRHDMANTFQVAILAQANTHKQETAEERTRADARTERLAAAIEHQTQELRDAIEGTCRFQQGPLPPDRKPV